MNRDDASVLTVEEAARELRIGRGTAYAQARRWRETNGQEGLPVIVMGKCLRVPRAALDRLKVEGSRFWEASDGNGHTSLTAHQQK